jgi:hypothetical protein
MRSNLLALDLGVVKSTLWSVEAPWLLWLDERGKPLLFPSEAALAAEAERQHAEAERQRAEARLEEYERRFGPLK